MLIETKKAISGTSDRMQEIDPDTLGRLLSLLEEEPERAVPVMTWILEDYTARDPDTPAPNLLSVVRLMAGHLDSDTLSSLYNRLEWSILAAGSSG